MREDNTRLCGELKASESSAKDKGLEITRLSGQLSDKSEQLAKLLDQLNAERDLAKRAMEYQGRSDALGEEAGRLMSEIEDLRNSLKKEVENARDKEATIASLSAHTSELESQIERGRDERDSLRKQLDELKAALAGMYSC